MDIGTNSDYLVMDIPVC